MKKMEIIIIGTSHIDAHLNKALPSIEKMGHTVVVVEQQSIPEYTIEIKAHESPMIDLKVAVEQRPYKPGVASWHNPTQKKFRKGSKRKR